MDRNELQFKAIGEWLAVDKKGTLQLSTGCGKTIAALHCLYTMPKNDGKIHLFLAEATDRKKDLYSDILLYNKLFNVNVLNDYNLKFYCYQTVYKWKNEEFGLVIADEIHNSMSEEYSKFYFNNKYDAIVGLSATIDRNASFESNGIKITKGELIDDIAPVCFTYTLAEAKEDGIGRNLNIYVIKHRLDEITKNIPAGSPKKRFFQTELSAYNYWDKEHKRSWFIEDKEMKELKIRVTATKRSQILFNLPSKIRLTTKLLEHIEGKSIIFSNSLDSLTKVTPNVVSSLQSDEQNKKIRDNFDKGLIQTIGSFKKLRQGANLKDLDNCILMSYYSSETHIVQQLGRLRKNKDKVGNAFIILTENTQEEIWFTKMMENLNDFNIIYCDNVKDCILKYKKK